MSMKEQLEQAKSGFIARVPVEAQSQIFRHIAEQQQSGRVYGLKVGDIAPNFVLTNPLGEQITLYDELIKGPVILTFYRGSWCPYCNIQLRAYQEIMPKIHEYGAQLLAITPQSPDNSLTQKEKEQLTFQVLSDPHGLVAERYHLLFEMPDYLQHTFKHILGRDLTAFNKTDRWILPIPGIYLLDRERVVRFTHANPDFMTRMEPQDLITQLKKL
ncbi:Thiol-disulfide oxidoreductase ResA [Paenibacillus allorhizoplanae]|uniref:thioredoxin-dependent peroxiredoxin n=1 Tax=Paenibacillus allorhizoplanae TaxID=2905648 RepID=A0ABM9BWJ6_9BACL|nr:peroxiredoxin-like family protein [Paenibacillus allorhizoplanae]CAH1194886.1 Thiol-disulfide oxidoreductase ResA [Paenibacillus allorhizoplanae]